MTQAIRIAVLASLLALGAAGYALFLRPSDHAILIRDAVAVPMGAGDALAVTLTIENLGAPDRLVGARAPDAAAAMLVGVTSDRGLPIPAGATPALAMDGAHLMLRGVAGDLAEGRLLPVTLDFAGAGAVATRVRVATASADLHRAHGMGAYHNVPEGQPAPTVELSARPAAKAEGEGEGWQIRVTVENFAFAPELADGPHVPGTGHGHLYLGGLKLGRVYAPEFRLGALPPGPHALRVTLNTNDHRTYAVQGTPVTATLEIGGR